MLKLVSDYLDTVCRNIRSEKRQQTVRSELAGHFAESIDALMKSGMSEYEAALLACERMGDKAEIGRKLAQANRQIPALVSFSMGFTLVLITVLLGCFATGLFFAYVDLVSFILIFGIAIGLALMGGMSGLTLETFFKRTTITSLYGGGIYFLMGLIATLSQVPNWDIASASLSIGMLSLVYSLLFSGLSYSARTLVNTLKPKDARDVLGIRKNPISK